MLELFFVLLMKHSTAQQLQIENANINLNQCRVNVKVPNIKKFNQTVAQNSKCEFLMDESKSPKVERFNRDSVLLIKVEQKKTCHLRALILKQNQQSFLSKAKRAMASCSEIVNKSEFEYFYFQESLKI